MKKLAIDVVETLLSNSYKSHRYEVLTNLNLEGISRRRKFRSSELLQFSRADTHKLTLIIDDTKKQFQGERCSLCSIGIIQPKIVCLLALTIEGWLYTRPDRVKLENSISLIFNRTSSVAMLGCTCRLLNAILVIITRGGSLLPLISSYNLALWLEF
jgi:hypothetical protein